MWRKAPNVPNWSGFVDRAWSTRSPLSQELNAIPRLVRQHFKWFLLCEHLQVGKCLGNVQIEVMSLEVLTFSDELDSANLTYPYLSITSQSFRLPVG